MWLLYALVLKKSAGGKREGFWTNVISSGDFKTAWYWLCHAVIDIVTLIQIYNEKEQAGKKETQNMQFGEKRSPGNVMLEERQLKESQMLSEMNVVIPSEQDLTQLILEPVRKTDPRSHLFYRGNSMQVQCKERASFQSRQVPELGSFSQTHSSGFKNAGIKGLRNLPWFLKKPNTVAERSLHGAQRGYCVRLWRWSLISLETPRCWRFQTHGTSAKGSCTQCIEPAKNESIAVYKAGRRGRTTELSNSRTSDMELQDLEAALLGFNLALVQHFLTVPYPSLLKW